MTSRARSIKFKWLSPRLLGVLAFQMLPLGTFPLGTQHEKPKLHENLPRGALVNSPS